MSKPKLIVLEGFDRTGKDTLINSVLQKYDVLLYKQPTSESCGVSYRDIKAFEKYLSSHYEQVILELIELSKKNKTVITSRLYISDEVYSTLFNRKYQFGELAKKYNLENYFEIHNFCLLWKSYDEYLKRVKESNSKIEYNKEEFLKLNNLFDSVSKKNSSIIKYIKNNTKKEFILKIFENSFLKKNLKERIKNMKTQVKEILAKKSFMSKIFADIVESEEFSKVVNEIVNVKTYNDLPEFIFTGVGKNWYICEKVTKTFLSLGLQAQALDPVHAIHGDIGMLSSPRNKVMVFISKSGTSEELVKLAKVVRYLKQIGHIHDITTIGLFLNRHQEEGLYDHLIVPSEKYDNILYPEYDSRDIIPSLTINTMQSILDMFGICIYEEFPELIERYKYNHLAGANGRRLGVNQILEQL